MLYNDDIVVYTILSFILTQSQHTFKMESQEPEEIPTAHEIQEIMEIEGEKSNDVY